METFEVGINAFCIMILLQDTGSQEVKCGSVDITDPHNLIGNGALRRCGFAGVHIAS